ncbi:hypothetical protein DN473_31545 [Burkholderia multivorans]|nr:hypothetical protein DN473_31545 [Burkholderia multivorans]
MRGRAKRTSWLPKTETVSPIHSCRKSWWRHRERGPVGEPELDDEVGRALSAGEDLGSVCVAVSLDGAVGGMLLDDVLAFDGESGGVVLGHDSAGSD